jgi:very-short-patch-repair endonuclease
MDAPKRTIARARQLRATMSLPEVLLWRQLRRQGLEGLRFRRQHPLGPYILDFYCEETRLAVEVDGQGHGYGDQPAYDERRDAWLAQQGVRVLRLSARLVLREMDSALRTILAAMDEFGAVRPPSPASRGLPPEGEDPGLS